MKKIKLNEYAKSLQQNLDDFIETNLPFIKKQIESNLINITGKFEDFEFDKVNKNSWGVYVFYVKLNQEIPKFEDLEGLWNAEKLKSPKVIKSRFRELEEGVYHCLYVGKSENLRKRINQHIHQETNPSTYGLKLSEHSKFTKNNEFKVGYFVLDENPSKNLDAMKYLLVMLEKELRAELKPLIGKQ